MVDGETFVIILVTIAVTAYNISLLYRIKKLEQDLDDTKKVTLDGQKFVLDKMAEMYETFGKQIKNVSSSMPTPEELARQIIKVKIPIDELPEDMRAMMPQPEEPPVEKKKKKGKENYFG